MNTGSDRERRLLDDVGRIASGVEKIGSRLERLATTSLERELIEGLEQAEAAREEAEADRDKQRKRALRAERREQALRERLTSALDLDVEPNGGEPTRRTERRRDTERTETR